MGEENNTQIGLEPHEMPYIERKIPKEVLKESTLEYAKGRFYENMSEEEEEQSKQNFRYFLMAMAVVFVFICCSATPFFVKHSGETGNFMIFPYAKTLRTAHGEKVEYSIQKLQNTVFINLIYEDGREISMNSNYPGQRMYLGAFSPLEPEYQDIYAALMKFEADFRGEKGNGALSLTRIPAALLGIFAYFYPYHMADAGVFVFIYWEKYFRSPRFVQDCKRASLVWVLFSLTPWGEALTIRLFFWVWGPVFWV